MQSKKHSAAEALTNSVVGLVASYVVTLLVLTSAPEATAQNAAFITGVYFIISTARSFMLRRLFNRLKV